MKGVPQGTGSMAGKPCAEKGQPSVVLRDGTPLTIQLSSLRAGAHNVMKPLVRGDPKQLQAAWKSLLKPSADWREAPKELLVDTEVMCSLERLAPRSKFTVKALVDRRTDTTRVPAGTIPRASTPSS